MHLEQYFLNQSLLPCNAHGLHSLQVIVDTLAYAENIPIRLLALDKLIKLPETIENLLEDEQTGPYLKKIIATEINNCPEDTIKALGQKELLDKALEILDFCAKKKDIKGKGNEELKKELKKKLEEFPDKWWKAILSIQSHIEANFWVTLIGNPLPAYGLCRLQPSWSLYHLLLSWKNANLFFEKKNQNNNENDEAINFLKYRKLYLLPGNTTITLKDHKKQPIALSPVIGPLFDATEAEKSHNDFIELFLNFCSNLPQISDAYHDLYIIPTEVELKEAFAVRIDFMQEEIKLRLENIEVTLVHLLATEIENPESFSRRDWEDITAYYAYYSRWKKTFDHLLKPNDALSICYSKSNLALIIEKSENGSVFFKISRDPNDRNSDLDSQLRKINENNEDEFDKDDNRIDRFDIFYNRVRERQNASWTRQTIAINRLLLTHGEKINHDNKVEEQKKGSIEGEKKHLLKGLGRYVCRYLVNIARADFSDIYWLDWASKPGQLCHVSGFSTNLVFRAYRDERQKSFNGIARKKCDSPEEVKQSEAFKGEKSTLQAYRIIGTGEAELYGKDSDDLSYLSEPRPESNLGLPIIVNNRIFGVILLGGMVKDQFDDNLLPPLRNAIHFIGATMYHQSQQASTKRIIEAYLKQEAETDDQNQLILEGAEQTNSSKHTFDEIAKSLSNIFLCEVTQIWALNEKHEGEKLSFNLTGSNWYGPFTKPDKKHDPLSYSKSYKDQSFGHQPQAKTPERDSYVTSFAGLAIDLVVKNVDPFIADENQMGKFVQGTYDKETHGIEIYNAKTAYETIVRLGSHFLPSEEETNEEKHIVRRRRIFSYFQLNSIMAFPLIEPKISDDFDARVIGVITLHSKSLPFNTEKQWGNEWHSIVKDMQDYLTYVIQQYLSKDKGKLMQLNDKLEWQ